MIKHTFVKLSALPRSAKRYILMLADFIVFPLLLWLALFLRLGDTSDIPSEYLSNLLYISVFCVVSLKAFSVYRAVVRSFEEKFLQDLVWSVGSIVLVLFLVASFHLLPLPRSAPFTFGFFVFLMMTRA